MLDAKGPADAVRAVVRGEAVAVGHGRRRRRIVALAAAAVLLCAGVLLGYAWSGRQLVGQADPAPAPPPVTRVVTRAVVPASCLTALDQTDAAVRLLKGNARDARLTDAVRAFQRSRDACRKQASSR
jgi:hypothetical protein